MITTLYFIGLGNSLLIMSYITISEYRLLKKRGLQLSNPLARISYRVLGLFISLILSILWPLFILFICLSYLFNDLSKHIEQKFIYID